MTRRNWVQALTALAASLFGAGVAKAEPEQGGMYDATTDQAAAVLDNLQPASGWGKMAWWQGRIWGQSGSGTWHILTPVAQGEWVTACGCKAFRKPMGPGVMCIRWSMPAGMWPRLGLPKGFPVCPGCEFVLQSVTDDLGAEGIDGA